MKNSKVLIDFSTKLDRNLNSFKKKKIFFFIFNPKRPSISYFFFVKTLCQNCYLGQEFSGSKCRRAVGMGAWLRYRVTVTVHRLIMQLVKAHQRKKPPPRTFLPKTNTKTPRMKTKFFPTTSNQHKKKRKNENKKISPKAYGMGGWAGKKKGAGRYMLRSSSRERTFIWHTCD